ncbi:MAG: DUF192 domain-containing protein [Asticcacaulis sp.]
MGISLMRGITLAILSLALFACAPASTPAPESVSVTTKQGVHAFQVEIADDDQERETGLMNRDSLAEDRGMLFLFPDVRERAFWMKNTHIPLDIIYLSKSGEVVSIQKNTIPMNETPLQSYGPAAAVLEINAGLSDRLGIVPGDKVSHVFFTSGASSAQ